MRPPRAVRPGLRDAVDPSLGLSEQLERPHRPLAHPFGERGALHDRDQFADMPVRAVVVVVGRIVIAVVMVVRVGSAARRGVPSGRQEVGR